MGFFSQIEGPVKSVLNQFLNDTGLRVMITYKRFDSQAFSTELGQEVNSFTDFSLRGIRLQHTQASQLVGVGGVEVGDQVYLIAGEDAPTGMSLKDEIVTETGDVQKIKNVNPIFGLAVTVTVEGGTA